MSKNAEKPAKPSTADYPVDPAERSNQEARLRRAAAAGASASKLPIPGLMLQSTAPAPAPQKIVEPQTTLLKPTVSTETAPEATAYRTDLQTTNYEVLAELRKISAWAEQQRK